MLRYNPDNINNNGQGERWENLFEHREKVTPSPSRTNSVSNIYIYTDYIKFQA
jgi:hypothetical protein